METQIFNWFYPISIISFLSAVKLQHGTNGVHKRDALWLLHFSMRRPASVALNAYIALLPKPCNRPKEGNITSYCEDVNYLVETYATVAGIAESDAYMMLSLSHRASRVQNTLKHFETRCFYAR